MHALGLGLLAILLMWDSVDPGRVVVIQRREATTLFQRLGWVTGTVYLDRYVTPGQEYCYRARYQSGTEWTPETCTTAPPPTSPAASQEVPFG